MQAQLSLANQTSLEDDENVNYSEFIACCVILGALECESFGLQFGDLLRRCRWNDHGVRGN